MWSTPPPAAVGLGEIAAFLDDPADDVWADHWSARLSERVGIPLSVAAVGFLAVAGSELVAVGIDLIYPLPMVCFVLSAIIPALVSPPLVWYFFRLTKTTSRLTRRNREVAAAYRALAFSDQLTGLLNRRGLYANLMAYDSDCDLLLGVADINSFKQINDTYGHDVGDQALVAVGRRLRHLAGPAGLVARTGGDEYVLVITGPERLSAQRPDQLAVLLLPGLVVRLSLGWRHSTPRSVEASMRAADSAMYLAKAQDGSRRAGRL